MQEHHAVAHEVAHIDRDGGGHGLDLFEVPYLTTAVKQSPPRLGRVIWPEAQGGEGAREKKVKKKAVWRVWRVWAHHHVPDSWASPGSMRTNVTYRTPNTLGVTRALCMPVWPCTE